MGFLREIPSVGLCYGFDRRNRIIHYNSHLA